MTPERKRARCAIYARKSSEEGLEQSFNSLDAQREACLAYVESQRHEGWKALETRYDDGGYSGGSMERPALQTLLGDIQAGKVDVVVVYKVDRLTRSLADFAKIVELFDARGVSFVSVTQQFNTTSSMGRLTLNVLLSFAQFEREVTGERIRDKIAASKKKGMWMGGHVPLGYDLKERTLIPNLKEAKVIRTIYQRYLDLGCVRKLQSDLRARKIFSKRRIAESGKRSGGLPYSRGALYSILQNRLYLGEVAHRGAVYPGQHQALVSQRLWDQVQARLATNGQARRLGLHAKTPSLLAGLLFDDKGVRYTPLHTTKGGKRYRYYASQAVIRDAASADKSAARRIPAHDIEALVCKRIASFLRSAREVLDAVSASGASAATQQALVRAAKARSEVFRRNHTVGAREFLLATLRGVSLGSGHADIRVSKQELRRALLGTVDENAAVFGDPASGPPENEELLLRVEADFRRHTGQVRMIIPATESADTPPRVNDVLVKAIARARRWYEMLLSGDVTSLRAIAEAAGLNERYVSRVLRCAFLAPDIVKAILGGTQPQALTLDTLIRKSSPVWSRQRESLSCR